MGEEWELSLKNQLEEWELEMYFYWNVLFKPKSVGVFLNHKIEDPKQGKLLK